VAGAAGFWSTAQWLRAAFEGLHYEIHQTVAGDELVAVNSSMIGTHTAPIACYAGRPFTMSQSHWFRLREGRITEHWADRDDLGTARQLGWIPPPPAHLLRMARAKRRAKRS
jgi:predicted ester cyclase